MTKDLRSHERVCLHRSVPHASGQDLQSYIRSRVEVQANGCWKWLKARTWRGYGTLQLKRCPEQLAHRAAWFAFRGPISPGMMVCHRCDWPPCCNPDHLFVGSHADNMRDMHRKGRANISYGTAVENASTTEEKIAALKHFAREGFQVRVAARLMGIGEAVAYRAVAGKAWRHVR